MVYVSIQLSKCIYPILKHLMLIPDPKYLYDFIIVSRLPLQLHMYNFDCIIPGKMEVAASFSESKRTRQTTHRLVQLLRQCRGQSINNKPVIMLRRLFYHLYYFTQRKGVIKYYMYNTLLLFSIPTSFLGKKKGIM